MSNARLKVLVAVLMGVLTVASTYGVWEWGRDKNYWGTSDEVAALWDLSIVEAAEGLPGGIVDRAQRPNGEFMAKPEPAYIEFSVMDEGDERTSERLRNLAEERGWTIEENCAANIQWCAQMTDDQGFQLLMTISNAPMQAVEDATDRSPYLWVKVIYL